MEDLTLWIPSGGTQSIHNNFTTGKKKLTAEASCRGSLKLIQYVVVVNTHSSTDRNIFCTHTRTDVPTYVYLPMWLLCACVREARQRDSSRLHTPTPQMQGPRSRILSGEMIKTHNQRINTAWLFFQLFVAFKCKYSISSLPPFSTVAYWLVWGGLGSYQGCILPLNLWQLKCASGPLDPHRDKEIIENAWKKRYWLVQHFISDWDTGSPTNGCFTNGKHLHIYGGLVIFYL